MPEDRRFEEAEERPLALDPPVERLERGSSRYKHKQYVTDNPGQQGVIGYCLDSTLTAKAGSWEFSRVAASTLTP